MTSDEDLDWKHTKEMSPMCRRAKPKKKRLKSSRYYGAIYLKNLEKSIDAQGIKLDSNYTKIATQSSQVEAKPSKSFGFFLPSQHQMANGIILLQVHG